MNLRQGKRFPLQLEFTYESKHGSCTGRTINIGSRGLLAAFDRPLPIGSTAVLSLAWPVTLDEHPLQLVVGGRILRADENGIAFGTERYEFKMRGKRQIAAVAPFKLAA